MLRGWGVIKRTAPAQKGGQVLEGRPEEKDRSDVEGGPKAPKGSQEL